MGSSPASDVRLVVYFDFDWAMGSVDRKFYSGNAIFTNRYLVAWFTHKQPAMAVSSAKAEHFAACDACKDGLNKYHFLRKIMQVNLPIPIHMDSQGAMYMAINMVTNKMSNRMDLRYHLIRDFANKGVIKLEYISTAHNITSVVTKPL